MTDPLDTVFEAVRDHRTILIWTRDRRCYSGKPLYLGPHSVWMVINGDDHFIKFTDIDIVETIPETPEGAA